MHKQELEQYLGRIHKILVRNDNGSLDDDKTIKCIMKIVLKWQDKKIKK